MNGQRILLVEDEEILRGVVSQALKMHGWLITEASNGVEALRLYRQQPFDLVITDLIMPEKEGLETIQELRKTDPNAKIIAMSGRIDRTGSGYLTIAKHFGAVRSIAKPFTAEQLIALVKEVLSS